MSAAPSAVVTLRSPARRGAIARLPKGIEACVFDIESVLGQPGSVRFLHAVRAAGVPTALVSGGANCGAMLDAAGIADLFDVRVDGTALERAHLGGRPAHASFLFAARELGVDAAAAAVFEDAHAGVAAARAGRFGYVVGVDRGGPTAALAHGADIVVGDLGELLAS